MMTICYLVQYWGNNCYDTYNTPLNFYLEIFNCF